jgi:glycerophosphoryl diester phosphodiesterase
MKTASDSQLINLRNRSWGYARQSLLIAHRGGVITTTSPENSLKAIRLAGGQAYDMVELDVVSTADGTPVLFYGPAGHLGRDCGVDAYIHELSTGELTNIHYRESDQSIITLNKALKTCFEL